MSFQKPSSCASAYIMAVLFNCIAEGESDLLIDPYLNSLSSTA